MSSKTIALLNMKGGVGKTTLSVNLAWVLSVHYRHKVLLIDLDPQFNASQWLMQAEEWDKHRKEKGTVANVLLDHGAPAMPIKAAKAPAQSIIKKAIFRRWKAKHSAALLDFLPSELELSRAIKAPSNVPYKLEKALEEIRNDYDHIIIDCAPTDSVLTDTALMASDFVLVPMRPDRFSVLGYAQISRALNTFRGDYPDPHKVKDLGVVFTMVEGNSLLESECMTEVASQASYVFKAQIDTSRSFAKAVKEHLPVFATSHTRNKTKSTLTRLVEEVRNRAASLSAS